MTRPVVAITGTAVAVLLSLVPTAACGQQLLATGQTTLWGPGSDGDVRAGLPLSYTDNGDGTITDNNTGLVWEKKDDSGGVHDVHNRYTWGPTGTMVTQFLATLNQAPCFAGHCNWRIPTLPELQGLVNFQLAYPGPMIDPVFHNAAACRKCADVTSANCSCTGASRYWSSTIVAGRPEWAWFMSFRNGNNYRFNTRARHRVRAVRDGP
jgi:hypothetical protein